MNFLVGREGAKRRCPWLEERYRRAAWQGVRSWTMPAYAMSAARNEEQDQMRGKEGKDEEHRRAKVKQEVQRCAMLAEVEEYRGQGCKRKVMCKKLKVKRKVTP